MAKGAFYGLLAAHAALVLFALSPLAPMLGMIVAGFFVVPVLILFAVAGGVANGQDADLFVAFSFLTIGVVFALVALACFYRAADAAQKGDPGTARSRAMTGITLVNIPLVMYLCYRSLQI